MVMRRVINEHKGIVKTLNIVNVNVTQIWLLHFCQITQLSIQDRQKTEADLAKLQFLKAQATYNTPQGAHHTSMGVYVGKSSGRQYTFNQDGDSVWLDYAGPPPTPQSKFKSFSFIDKSPEA